MSTHLEHGYRLAPMTLEAFSEWANQFRRQIDYAEWHLRHQAVARLAAEIVDEFALTTSPAAALRDLERNSVLDREVSSMTVGTFAGKTVRAKYLRAVRGGSRDLDYDWSCELLVLPHEGRVYALLFAEQSLYHAILRRQPGVTPYPYWDHCDGPKGLSHSQWRARLQEWEHAIGPSGIPARRGITIKCGDASDIYARPEEMVRFQPSLHSRVREQAMLIAERQWARGKRGLSPYDYIKGFERWRSGKAGRLAVARASRAVAARLPRAITAEMTRTLIPILHKEMDA